MVWMNYIDIIMEALQWVCIFATIDRLWGLRYIKRK